MSADLVLVAVALGVSLAVAVAVVARFIRPRVERIGENLETMVKARLFPARHLDLLALQQKVVAVALAGVDTSASGDRHLSDVQTVQVSPSDHTRLVHGSDGGLDRVQVELAIEIARRATKLGYKVPERLEVSVVRSVFALDGRPIRLATPIPDQATSSVLSKAAPETPPTPTTTDAPNPLSSGPAAETTRSGELPPAPPVRRRGADPLMLEGTRTAATRRWGSDETVNIDEAKLEPTLGGRAIRLAGRRTVVGRRPDAGSDGEGVGAGVDVTIDETSVSTRHAELLCQAGVWSVVDQHSTNGTYVNGHQVRRRDLTDGDYVQFSSEGPTYVFRLQREFDRPDRPNTSDDRLTTRRSR